MSYEPGPQPYQPPPQPHVYAEQSQATTVLVLGILGLVVCGLCAPFAWSMGNTEVQGIDAGRRPPENRQTAQIGRILGIVGTVLLLMGLIVGLLALFIVFFAAAA